VEKPLLNMRVLTVLAYGLLAATGATRSLAADDSRARTLHDKHCFACHGTEMYTGKKRKVESFPALESQVRRCETVVEGRWSNEEISAVTRYLNNRFYHFRR